MRRPGSQSKTVSRRCWNVDFRRDPKAVQAPPIFLKFRSHFPHVIANVAQFYHASSRIRGVEYIFTSAALRNFTVPLRKTFSSDCLRKSGERKVVPGAGIEPARWLSTNRRILSPLRLPVPPSGHINALVAARVAKNRAVARESKTIG